MPRFRGRTASSQPSTPASPPTPPRPRSPPLRVEQALPPPAVPINEEGFPFPASSFITSTPQDSLSVPPPVRPTPKATTSSFFQRRPALPRNQTIARKIAINHPLPRGNTWTNTDDAASDIDNPHEKIHFRAYESIAFEEPDGPGLRRHFSKQSALTRIQEEMVQYLLAGWLCLQISHLYVLLLWGTEKLGNKRIELYAGLVDDGSVGSALWAAVWTTVVAACVPALCVILFAPGVIGSGMTQLIAFLNGSASITQSTAQNVLIRYLGIFGVAVSGLYSGADGPMALIGGALAVNQVQKIRKQKFLRKFFYGESRPLKKEDHAARAGRNALFMFLEQKALRLFATLGAAIGISAIFRSPLGGVLFTLEETTSFFEPRIMIRTLFCTTIAALVVGAYATLMVELPVAESFSTLGGLQVTLFPTEVQCSRVHNMAFGDSFKLLLGYALFGFVMAFLGQAWNRALSAMQGARQPYTIHSLENIPPPPAPPTREERKETRRLQREANQEQGIPHKSYRERRAEREASRDQEGISSPRTGRDRREGPRRDQRVVRRRTMGQVEVRYTVPSTKRTLFSIIRLAEVALVGIVTCVIVVLLPTISGLDPCVPLHHATDHVVAATPDACYQGVQVSTTVVSDALLKECLVGLQGVCLPDGLKIAYEESIIRNFYNASEQGFATATARKAEGSPLGETVDAEEKRGLLARRNAVGLERGRSSTHALDYRKMGLRVRAEAEPNEVPGAADGGGEGGDAAATTVDQKDALVPETDLEEQHAQLGLDDTCFYPLRSLLYAMPEAQLKLLLTRGLYGLLNFRALGIFLAVYCFLSLITYYIALPTDLVIPNLLVGATAGRLLGLAWNSFEPSILVDPGFFALIGMAGMWSATSRLTITVVVISFEVTGDADSIPALIVVCFVSAWTASFLGESLYHLEMHKNHTPYLPAEPSHQLFTVPVRKVMTHRNLVVVTTTAKMSSCVEAVESGHVGFPVCEKLLVEDTERRTVTRYRPVGFVYRNLLNETLRTLLVKEGYNPETTRLDLTAIMNVSPVIVKDDATASKVFRMVRSLGLRHIMVVDRDGFLVGIVTRKDLLRGMHDLNVRAKRRRAAAVKAKAAELNHATPAKQQQQHRHHHHHGHGQRATGGTDTADHSRASSANNPYTSSTALIVEHTNVRGERSSLVLPVDDEELVEEVERVEKIKLEEQASDHTVVSNPAPTEEEGDGDGDKQDPRPQQDEQAEEVEEEEEVTVVKPGVEEKKPKKKVHLHVPAAPPSTPTT
ncbi:hypothetical protein HKX48_000660, partial [Thoreauomyces humboldtii]